MDEDLDFDYQEADCGTQFHVDGIRAVKAIKSFEDSSLNLNPRLQRNIKDVFGASAEPTLIQGHAMPQLMAELDVMCCSHTGTGKTATYVIPLLNIISKSKKKENGGLASMKVSSQSRNETENVSSASTSSSNSSSSPKSSREKVGAISAPSALILVPTRELAEQVCKDARKFARGLCITFLAVYGGKSMGYELDQLQRGDIDVIVATPGRLFHILSEFNVLELKTANFLVIDEADELFSRGFFHQIGDIIQGYMKPKEQRVTTMFSATFPFQIRFFAQKHLRQDHVFIVIGIFGGVAPDIEQDIHCVSKSEKQTRIVKILKSLDEDKKILVFCETIEGVKLLADLLSRCQFKSAMIHSEMLQTERNQALNDFHVGNAPILVATSVAARGLNIKDVSTIINYDLPREIADYIQRIGRTRRLTNGEMGNAISFWDPDTDQDLVVDLCFALRSVKQEVPEFLIDADNRRENLKTAIENDYGELSVDLCQKMLKCTFAKEYNNSEDNDWFG